MKEIDSCESGTKEEVCLRGADLGSHNGGKEDTAANERLGSSGR